MVPERDRIVSNILNIKIDSIDETLEVINIRGEEALSRSFEYIVTFSSSNQELKAKDFIGKKTKISITEVEEQPRLIHGCISTFESQNINAKGCRFYAVILKPWFYFLSYTQDCRVFQDMTVPDIITDLFKEYGYQDFDLSELQNSYTPRAYCTQYNESVFNFISRLCEEEGLYYFYKYDDDKHLIMFQDSGFAGKNFTSPLTYRRDQTRKNSVVNWTHKYELTSNAVKTSVYQYQNPSELIESKISLQGDDKNYERYSYPSEIATTSQSALDDLVRVQIARQIFSSSTVSACSNCSGLEAGMAFMLTDHVNSLENGEYVITKLTVFLNPSDESLYVITGFNCVPNDGRIMPEPIIPKPKITGLQSAIVVGSENEEIHTDFMGRIKVQFHWDRHGENDENSSCWIRTTQLWAGNGYGAQFIPRVGQEVLVDFEEGNPDRPFVIGTVPNADTMMPFDPETNPSQLGIKTHSFNEEDTDKANVLRFDDKEDQEEIWLHAQRDMSVEVKDSSVKNIGGKSQVTIGQGDLETHIGGKLIVKAINKITLSCGESEIIIKPNGVDIQGKKVKMVKSSVKVPELPSDPYEAMEQATQS